MTEYKCVLSALYQLYCTIYQQQDPLTLVFPYLFPLLLWSLIPPEAPPIVSGINIQLLDSLWIPLRTISTNASLTATPSLAEVSKYGMSLFSLHQACAFSFETFRSLSLSTLLPISTNGNDLGSSGWALSTNPSFHLFKASKEAGLVKSKVRAQQSAPLQKANPSDQNFSYPAVSQI